MPEHSPNCPVLTSSSIHIDRLYDSPDYSGLAYGTCKVGLAWTQTYTSVYPFALAIASSAPGSKAFSLHFSATSFAPQFFGVGWRRHWIDPGLSLLPVASYTDNPSAHPFSFLGNHSFLTIRSHLGRNIPRLPRSTLAGVVLDLPRHKICYPDCFSQGSWHVSL